MFSDLFESSICCRFPDDRAAQVDFFSPLYALVKTYLRNPKSGIDVADVKRWLQPAARQGNNEAVRLLTQNFGQEGQYP